MRKELGKSFLDLSKLVFAGVVLAGLMDMKFNPFWLFPIGLGVVFLTALAGFIFLNNKK